MIILTCANKDVAKDDSGNLHKGFSFRSVIQKTEKQAKVCGYTPVIYDLGSLGIGEPYIVHDRSFQESGYYAKEPQKGYKSKSLFKPEIVKISLEKHQDTVVYLDGDAQLCDCIDEVDTNDYDVGVTLRKRSEIESEWHRQHMDIAKYVNAGVIFFQSTPTTMKFVNDWESLTKEVGNDQQALNNLICPDSYPEPNSIHVVNGVRVKFFPCEKYNYYHFNDGLEQNIKIIHFKGNVRKFYPFNLPQRLYCLMLIPLLNKLKKIYKSIMKRR